MLVLHLRDAPAPLADSCAYTTLARLCDLEDPLSMSTDSDTHEVLARRGWYLLVGPLVSATTTAAFRCIR
jgi:hypothetical protein